jgi:DNA-binding PadR family transcriptional regulator
MNYLFMTDTPRAGHGGRRDSGPRGRSRRRGGPPPWARGSHDTFGAFGPGVGGPRGRAGRGDVRTAVLLLLAEQPRHGYEIITEIVERSDGRWQPSPGSIYPVLKRLAAEGMVQAERDGDRRVFDLTDAGRKYVDAHAETLGEPWAEMDSPSEGTANLLDAARQVAAALWQVAQAGTEEQKTAATALMRETKRSLYLVLADGEPEDVAGTAGGPAQADEASEQ